LPQTKVCTPDFHSRLGEIMPWIKQIPVEEATGFLKKQFDKAIERAGRVWHIVHIMSLNPRVLEASIRLYSAALMGKSPLSRVQRELLATMVSAELNCHY
jgi:alkylhydroperoxidase family enzyme